MGAALQVLNFFKQNITGGAFEALAPGTGDSGTFQTVPSDPAGWLAEIWGVCDAHVAELSFTASRFHDQTFGIRTALPSGAALAPAGRATNVSPAGIDQPIYPADVMTVQVNATATDNVNVCCIVYYPNLPGVDFHGLTADQVRAHTKNLVGVRVSPTSGAGNWGASVALNSVTNLLHAGHDYALVGATCQTPVAAFGIQGIDSGNLRVGGPLVGDPAQDATLFIDLAENYKQPLVPVFQANNAGAINIFAAHTAAAAKAIDLLFVELDYKVIS